ncbi:MAG: Ig-like domain-containing protein, partial [Capnocytophaga sp.]|nr:Ig-like domain-containing protein [Capnocytophaga sp.]
TSTDDAGNPSTPTTTTVTDNTPPVPPTVNPISDTSTETTGTAEPESTVTVEWKDCNGTIHTATVSATVAGTWTAPVNPTACAGSTVTVTSTDDAGNPSTPTTVVVNKGPAITVDVEAPEVSNDPRPTIIGTTDVPEGTTVTITIVDSKGNVQTLVTTVDRNTPTNTYTATPTTDIAEGVYTVTAVTTDANGNMVADTAVRTLDLTKPAIIINPVKENDTEIKGTSEPGATITVTYPDGSTVTTTVAADGTWAVPTNPSVVEGSTITAEAKDAAGNTSDQTATVGKDCELVFYNAISPNSDGKNDVLRIGGIECYPDNKLILFNRWGVKVYEKERYDNVNDVFAGISQGRSTINAAKKLPEGTYYYILEYADGNVRQVKTGWLYIEQE